MFGTAVRLVPPVMLPATNLTEQCYYSMFNRCDDIEAGPILLAAVLGVKSCMGMYNRCSKLNYIKCLATGITASQSTSSMTNLVAATGTFVKSSQMNNWPSGKDGIPEGWQVVDDDTVPEYHWENVHIYQWSKVLDNKTDVYNVATTADIEGLFVPAPTYPARNQIWYETVNGQISNDFGLYVMLSGGVPATSSNIVSHTYSNGKGVITYDSDIYSLGYFPMEDSGQEDFVNNIKKFWLPYFTEEEEQQGDADIDMLNCLLIGQSNLTDVYYPGTIEELNYFVFPEEGASDWECLRGAGTNSIHCSDGDRRVNWG